MRSGLALASIITAVGCSLGVAARAQATHSSSTIPTGKNYYYGAYMPAGQARTDLKNDCEICHSGDMYATQRLSKPIWDAEVTKMMKWGSPLPKSDKTLVVNYLAKYLGPTVPRIGSLPSATAPPITYTSPPND
jgi:hypothetical protein